MFPHPPDVRVQVENLRLGFQILLNQYGLWEERIGWLNQWRMTIVEEECCILSRKSDCFHASTLETYHDLIRINVHLDPFNNVTLVPRGQWSIDLH